MSKHRILNKQNIEMLNNAEIAAHHSQISSSVNLESFGFMPCKRIYGCSTKRNYDLDFFVVIFVKNVGFFKNSFAIPSKCINKYLKMS